MSAGACGSCSRGSEGPQDPKADSTDLAPAGLQYYQCLSFYLRIHPSYVKLTIVEITVHILALYVSQANCGIFVYIK